MQNPVAYVSARRRLIRGVFSAPAALTLCSGSAFAAASNQQCVANAAVAAVQPLAVAAADTWIRVRAYNHIENGYKNSSWIKGSDVADKATLAGTRSSVVDANYVALSGTNSLCVYAEKNSGFTANKIVANLGLPTLPTSANGYYYAVLINTNGDIVGISKISSVSGGAVQQSCWTSFVGA